MNKTERIKNRIDEGFVVLDGGLGSLLQKKGLRAGELSESWNLSNPEVIKDIHKSYLGAGSDIIVSNTFGANCFKFGDDDLKKIIAAAFYLAKQAVSEYEAEHPQAQGRHFIGLDIGPLGCMLKPFGDLAFEDAVAAFRKTIDIAKDYDFDLIYIETMNDIYEAKAAVLAAKEEIHRQRQEMDKELRDRRNEMNRQERRVAQKEENLLFRVNRRRLL